MYKIQVTRQAMKDLADLPEDYAQAISRHIDDLANDPRPPGVKKLHGEEGYRVRVGMYRILYTIDDSVRMVTVYRIKHRREAYR